MGMNTLKKWTAGMAALACLPLVIMEVTADDDERARIEAVTRPTTDFTRPEQYERYPAGASTSFKPVNRDAFSHPSANMSFERELDFKVGNGIFKKVWVSAPSSTTASSIARPSVYVVTAEPWNVSPLISVHVSWFARSSPNFAARRGSPPPRRPARSWATPKAWRAPATAVRPT
jgi:hypothetical protein